MQRVRITYVGLRLFTLLGVVMFARLAGAFEGMAVPNSDCPPGSKTICVWRGYSAGDLSIDDTGLN